MTKATTVKTIEPEDSKRRRVLPHEVGDGFRAAIREAQARYLGATDEVDREAWRRKLRMLCGWA